MPLAIYNEGLDDTPELTSSESFSGADFATPANLLPPDLVRDGRNIYFALDGIAQTRPGLRLVARLAATAGTTGSHVQSLAFYDTPAFERALAVRDGIVYQVDGDSAGATVANLAGPTPGAGARLQSTQLVDRVFVTDGTNTLRWALYSGAWSAGSVATFSDASAMPAWGGICEHRFRLYAFDTDGNKLYASALGQAATAADWTRNDNLRFGSGEGDPIVALVSAQVGNLFVLCQGSAWTVDPTDPAPANWITQRVTGLTGCIAPRTVVQAGQEVLFLSRHGLVSLGALADNISISASTTISAPMQPIMDRINWQAIDTAFATTWKHYYLLALPLDSETRPHLFLVLDLNTRRWGTPWTSEPESSITGLPFAGWSAACVSRFSGRAETLLGDSIGRIYKIDPTTENDDISAVASQAVESYLTTKAEDFGSGIHPKSPFWIKLTFSNSTASLVSYALVRDANTSYPDYVPPEEMPPGVPPAFVFAMNEDTIEYQISTGTLGTWPILFPLVFVRNATFERSTALRNRNRFLEAGVQIHAAAGRLRLRRVRMAAFIDTPDLSNTA